MQTPLKTCCGLRASIPGAANGSAKEGGEEMSNADWFSRPVHEHYGPCDGLAGGDCSECRRMSWLAMKAADEIERLHDRLKKANDQAERFEREWYLRGDEIDRLRAELAASQDSDAESIRMYRDARDERDRLRAECEGLTKRVLELEAQIGKSTQG